MDIRWKALQKEDPDLPDLTILSSEGIASDEDFIEAFCTSDAILDNGKKFFYNQTSNIITTIAFIMSDPEEYAEARKNMRDSIRSMVADIEKVRALVKDRPEEFKRKLGDREFESLQKALVHADVIPAICANINATALR